MRHRTNLWQLVTPDEVPDKGAPSVVIATIHPRGDQRLLKCIQSVLDQRCSVHIIWLGAEVGSQKFDDWLHETVLAEPRSTSERILRTFAVLRRSLRAGSSIMYLHDFYMLPHAALWKALGQGRRIVFDSHEFYPKLYSAKFPRALRSIAFASLTRLSNVLYGPVDGFSLVSARMLSGVKLRGRPVIITPNYPSNALFDDPPIPAVVDGRVKIIHSGSLTPSYGAAVLVRAAAILHERRLEVQIDVVERYSSDTHRQWFQQVFEKSGRPACLAMIPPRPAREMREMLSEYGAGLSLIQRGGQNSLAVPTKIFEYATEGLYVIASDLPEQAAFVRDRTAVCGAVFEASSAEALADCIEDFTANSVKYNQMALESSEIARREFIWENSCAPQFGLFRRLCN